MSSSRPLLVEDDDAVRSILARQLKRDGYSVIPAPRADEAIRLTEYARERFALPTGEWQIRAS